MSGGNNHKATKGRTFYMTPMFKEVQHAKFGKLLVPTGTFGKHEFKNVSTTMRKTDHLYTTQERAILRELKELNGSFTNPDVVKLRKELTRIRTISMYRK